MKNAFGDDVLEPAASVPDTNAFGDPIIKTPKEPSVGDHILSVLDKAAHFGQPTALKIVSGLLNLLPGKNVDITPESIKGLSTVTSDKPNVPATSMENPMSAGLTQSKAGNAVTSGLVDAVTSPTSYIGEAAKPLAVVAKGAVPLVAKVGDLVSHASPEAITEASWINKGGRQGLIQAANEADNAGPKLTQAVQDFTKNMPEKAIIDQALPTMGKVNIQPAIDALESSKPKVITGKLAPDQQIISDKIDKYIDYLKGGSQGKFFKANYPASDALDIRKVLDSPIDFETGTPNPKEVQGALFKARTALRGQLENAAAKTGNQPYIDAMKSYHDKLDIVSQLQNLAEGTSDIGTDKKGANLLASLWKSTPDAAIKRKAVSDFDKVAGTDFLDQSKKAFLAAQKGYGKKPYEATKGVGIIAPIAEKAASALTSQVAIPVAKGIEVAAKNAAPASKIAGETLIISRLKDMIQNSTSPEQKAAAEKALARLQGTP